MKRITISLFFVLFISSLASANTFVINDTNFTFAFTNTSVTFPLNSAYSSIGIGTNYMSLNGGLFQVVPTSPVNITPTSWSPSSKSWSENGTADVNHRIGDNNPNSRYNVIQDGIIVSTLTSNSTGYLTPFNLSINGMSQIELGLYIPPSPCGPDIVKIIATTLISIAGSLAIVIKLSDTNNLKGSTKIQFVISIGVALLIWAIIGILGINILFTSC